MSTSVTIHHKKILIMCPDGGVIECPRLGDHEIGKPKVIKKTAQTSKEFWPALLARAKESLSFHHWSTR